MSGDDMITKLDEAAKILIDEAFPATPPSGEPAAASVPIGLADKIKAFGAVREWISDRKKLIPEERKSGKGEQLRAKFQQRSAPTSRRNHRSAAENGTAPQGDTGDTESGPVQDDAGALPN